MGNHPKMKPSDWFQLFTFVVGIVNLTHGILDDFTFGIIIGTLGSVLPPVIVGIPEKNS